MPTTPLQEETLAQLQDALGQLTAVAAATKDQTVYEAANAGIASIESRISSLSILQLVADTSDMQAQANAIAQSKAALDSTLKTIANATAVGDDIGKFLAAVDSLIKAAEFAVSL